MERIDWNRLWKEEYRQDNSIKSEEHWDQRASGFRKKFPKGFDDPYTAKFYELAEISRGETIFDMGCGSGTLAIPFARAGHEIWAADFSGAMLDQLMEDAEAEGVGDRIHPIKLDWNEDWSVRSLPVCDVAVASRSLFFEDLTGSLKKLESVASRRCCLGAWDGPSTGYDRYIARAIGFERPGHGCHYYIMNELMDRDVYPQMQYIFTPFRIDKFASYDEGTEFFRNGFDGRLTLEQEEKFEKYCRMHLKLQKDNEGNEFWQMDHGTMSSIAFIAWDIKTVFDE